MDGIAPETAFDWMRDISVAEKSGETEFFVQRRDGHRDGPTDRPSSAKKNKKKNIRTI